MFYNEDEWLLWCVNKWMNAASALYMPGKEKLCPISDIFFW